MKLLSSRRRLSNVRLTRKYRIAYMGLWIAVAMLLVVVMNAVLFLYVEERWAGLGSLSSAFHQQYISIRNTFILALVAETILFAFAIFGLAIMTTHRIAGPYVRLKAVFDEVRGGNYQQPLNFRKYDGLEDVAEAFNTMMEKVRCDLKAESQPEDK